jgi:hypothetical protein
MAKRKIEGRKELKQRIKKVCPSIHRLSRDRHGLASRLRAAFALQDAPADGGDSQVFVLV